MLTRREQGRPNTFTLSPLLDRQNREVRMRTLVEVVDLCDEVRATCRLAIDLGDEHRLVRLRAARAERVKPSRERTTIAFNQLGFAAMRRLLEPIDEPRRERRDELPIPGLGTTN